MYIDITIIEYIMLCVFALIAVNRTHPHYTCLYQCICLLIVRTVL